MRQAGEIFAAAFSPDGKLVMTGSCDHTARLWDTATGQPVGSPLRHRLNVRSVSFSPDGKLVLTASEDGTAKIWEIGAGESSRTPRGSRAMQEQDGRGSPQAEAGGSVRDGRLQSGPGRVILAGTDRRPGPSDRDGHTASRSARRWRIAGHGSARWLSAPTAVAFATSSHDSRIRRGTAARSRRARSGRSRRGGRPRRSCRISTTSRRWPSGPTARSSPPAITAVRCTSGMSRRARSLGPPFRAGSIVFRLCLQSRRSDAGGGYGRAGPSGDDLGSGRRRRLGASRSDSRGTSPGWLSARDGSRLAAASMDTTVRLVDVATGRAIGDPLRHAEAVRGLAFSPDGRLLLTVSSGLSGTGAARLWDVATGRPASPELAHPSVGLGSTRVLARRLALRNRVRGRIDLSLGRRLPPGRSARRGCSGVVSSQVAFRPDGRTLLAVDHRGDVRLLAHAPYRRTSPSSG